MFEQDDAVNLGRWSDPSCLPAVSTHWVDGDVSFAGLAPRMVATLVNLQVAP
ncbi:hypothetical protein SAMN05421878_1151 [Actinobaculum suis]|uniref:Uncharacterized protein n=1 Tax=Actinobaculum suis TaxID=1657 RepID=A0A1G7E4F7_9ACTO|nr:hypothetical protein SAMN05421878_1151 [Actinobaculum suis]